ncbi:ABC transporter ATP-binding protein [Streptococcus cameli]
MKPIVIKCSELSKQYGEQSVLNAFHLKAQEGQWIGLVGPNGSGKSTLAKILAGFEKPSSGFITLLDQSQESYQISDWFRNVQLIPQYNRDSLDPLKTVGSLLNKTYTAFFGEQFSTQEKQEQIATLLSDCKLDSTILSKRISTLSGGQYQRVCIALALLAKPKVLICDESTANLDKITEMGIIRLLQAQKNLTVLFISHDRQLVDNNCHMVYSLEQVSQKD